MNKASLKTKIVAGVLSAITLVSVATATTSTAFAATHTNELSVSAELQDDSNDILTGLAEKILKEASAKLLEMLKKKTINYAVNTDVAKIITSLLDISPETKLSDIKEALNEVSSKMDSYHAKEMKMLSNIMTEHKKDTIYDKLDEIKVKNKEVLNVIANKQGSRSTTDMNAIIRRTINDRIFETDLQRLEGFFYPSEIAEKKTVLEFCLDCLNSNTIDASKAKAQAENIAKTFIDQYKFAFDSFVVGHKAKVQKMLNEYNEARKTGNQEKIEEAKRAWELAKSDANNEINILIEKAQGVQEQYDKFLNYIKSSEQAYVTIDGNTTQFASFADAWYHVNTQNKNATIKLNKDINLDSIKKKLAHYEHYTDINNYFGENNINLLSSKKITIDLNGHNLTNSGGSAAIEATKVDGDYNLTIINSNSKDSNNNLQGTLGGIKLGIKSSLKSGNVSINDAIICGGGSTGIYSSDDCQFGKLKVTVDNCIIKGYTNSAVYLFQTRFTANNTKFEGNSSNYGGAISKSCDLSEINLNSCEFINNHANSCGGAIYYNGGSLKTEGCTFKNNSAGSTGGAMYVSCRQNGSNLKMYDTTITNNTAGKNAGGIYCDLDSQNLSTCDPVIGGKMTITNNTANGRTNNVFLKSNFVTKAILKVDKNRPVTSYSRIGISSDTDDKTLDVVKCSDKNSYNRAANVFSYDNSKYHIHG